MVITIGIAAQSGSKKDWVVTTNKRVEEQRRCPAGEVKEASMHTPFSLRHLSLGISFDSSPQWDFDSF